MTKYITPFEGETLWAISEPGFLQVKAIQDKIQAAGLKLKVSEGEGEDETPPYQRVGSAAVVDIKGPLVSKESFWTSMFGLPSYQGIQAKLLEAVEDPKVDRIILDIDSPGGAVNGVSATSDLIYAIDQQVKPVYAVTDGSLCSGAYWLASGAREIYGSELSSIGSIGVITTHYEFSEAFAKQGVKATVIRSGKYKQLGNPAEPLTEEGLQEIQNQLDTIYKVFVNHVSETRDKSYEYTDKMMAQGRVFMGQTAKEVGLIDYVANFQAAITKITAKTIDTSKFPYKIMA